MGSFPDALHICTYDVRGTLVDCGQPKPVRETGLVTHTHQLLRGLARRHPNITVAVTQTGAVTARRVGGLLTPEGLTVDLRTVATRFPQYLRDPRGAKSASRVRRYYEDEIDHQDNPVWASLAGQYAHALAAAGIPHLLLQNINPLVSVLKAEELGLLDGPPDGLSVTGVLHDAAGAGRRLGYLARRARRTAIRLQLIAVSESVRREAVDAGVPGDLVTTIVNGLDVGDFEDRLRQARSAKVFARVRERNQLPAGHRVVLVSARRVSWKGHEDVIRAAARLDQRGLLADTVVVFNGAGLLDTRSPDYEDHLTRLISELDLTGKVVLLDELSREEVASCYTAAHAAVLASREPEPFGYANIEAMLAGVPVIATGHGGPLEYIRDQASGLLVPPAAPDAIAAALQRLLTDDALHARIAAAGRASAERFTLEAMIDGYVAAISAGTASPAAAVQEAGAR
ncbi:glycosyltransferase family 4 protein [Streptomyces xinghaiensis]|uniref:glycosyltransferase family 4 protein n=1 Tax=Streptomyces xinghaiensis TaxID=1038928 RepID=UPI0005931626|nr:glycosyltransferase family 4 protein [Streptomyces xinghaiensis]MZE76810.1 glycosyltransferase [Streptomyces sp. SID5475]